MCVCGAICDGCGYEKECAGGCEAQQGRVFWARYIGAEVCPIYQCAKTNGYVNCGQCSKLPCQIWTDVKDPAQSDLEHQKSITDRVTKLKAATVSTGMV